MEVTHGVLYCWLAAVLCVIAVWEVFAAAHPWKGMTMGEVMTAVMIEGRRLVWGPGVPKVGAPPWEKRPAGCLA
jgi:hypothetical protein